MYKELCTGKDDHFEKLALNTKRHSTGEVLEMEAAAQSPVLKRDVTVE